MTYHFITAVWGDAYTDLFLRVALPAQLASGNLPAVRSATGAGSSYKIYTSARDAQVICASATFAELTRAIPVEVLLVEPIIAAQAGTKYDKMTACHKLAIRAARAAGAAQVFLSPDVVFSNGSFSRMCELAAAGRRVVLIAGIRASMETMVPELLHRFSAGDRRVMSVSGRELVDLLLRHLHPISESLFWDSPRFSTWPSVIYWPDPGGILARCFHLHPLMVNSMGSEMLPGVTIDGDYLERACPDLSTHHIVTDSDEIMCVELSARTHGLVPHDAGRADLLQIAGWARVHATRAHRQYVKSPISMHADAVPPGPSLARSRSDEVVQSLLRALGEA